MSESNRSAAGIDVSKERLDVGVTSSEEIFAVGNSDEGFVLLAERLRALGVVRVGVEASGHYEAGVVESLRREGFEVVVFDPRQVNAYRRFLNKRAKTDAIDASLIAEATAALVQDRLAPDPRLPALAEELTFLDQIGEDVARLKTRLDRYRDPALRSEIEAEIVRLSKRREAGLRALAAKVRAEDDLARRMELLETIPGLGRLTALAFVIRMPELGHLTRHQAAALVGVAPFNVDSGKRQGERHIAGGRTRLRHAVYMAAFSAAQRWNPTLKAFYKRLVQAGKPHKLATIACARKLVELANAILARGTPWTDQPQSSPNP
jgi:transposase